MKLSNKSITVPLLLNGLASSVAATSCETGKEYKGADLMPMDPAYESVMMSQLEYWSKNSNDAQGVVASSDNINKSFFKCTGTGDTQLDLMHWCACGIADSVNASTGEKTGEICVMPCSGAKDIESKAGSDSMNIVITAVCVSAVVFAAGML